MGKSWCRVLGVRLPDSSPGCAAGWYVVSEAGTESTRLWLHVRPMTWTADAVRPPHSGKAAPLSTDWTRRPGRLARDFVFFFRELFLFRRWLKTSRVERWRGGLGRGMSVCPGFPFVAQGRMPCSVSTSRSSNRTCRFPASGSPTRVTLSPTEGGGGRYGPDGPGRAVHKAAYPGSAVLYPPVLYASAATTSGADGRRAAAPPARLP